MRISSFLKEHYLDIIGYAFLAGIIIVIWLIVSTAIFALISHLHISNKNPLLLYHYWQTFGDPQIHKKIIISLIFPPVVSILIFFNTRKPSIYGKARWANMADARRAGLFAKKGILLGKKWGKYLCIGGHEHVIVFAPSGSGKTRGIAIPNLLTWQDSVICNDIKLELHKTTAEYRKKHGQKCFLWNPGAQDGKTDHYNPLDLIKHNPATRVNEAQKIASIFIPDNPRTDPIWYTLPRTLFVALILYVLDTPEVPTTIGAIMRLVKGTHNFIIWIIDTLERRKDLESICMQNFNIFLQLPEKTQGSILAALLSHFELFDNPLIDQATSHSDFDIRQLRRERMTIYVGITNDNLVRLAPLISIFYQQVADVMTRNEPGKDEPYSVLLLMDEFAALKRMDAFEKNMGLFRSYHLRVLTIVQDLSQIKREYGEEGSKIFINSKVKIAFAQSDLETARWLSNLLGKKTSKISNISRRKLSLFDFTETETSISEPLLPNQEILQIPRKNILVIVDGCQPLVGCKLFWDEDSMLKIRGQCR